MGIQFDGVNNKIVSGSKIDFPGSVGVAGTLTYEDVANVDSIGIITARTGINIGPTAGVAGTFFADGSYVTAGIITATTFHGSGANLTGIDLGAVTGATGDFSIADKIVHTGDTDTAIRFPSANEISFETAGSERVRINSTGNIGLGVASPNVLNEPAKFQELTLGGKTEGAAITLKDDNGNVQGGLFTSDNTGAMIVRTITNHFMQFRTNNTERLRIDTSGRVLIGTTTEGHGDADNLTIADSANSGITIRSGTSHSGHIYFSDGTSGADEYKGIIVYEQSSNYMAFWTNGDSEKLRITSTGRIGIGEDSPDGMLHLKGGVPAIFLEDSDGTHGQAIIEQSGDTLKFRQDAGNASSGTGSNIRFEIDSSEKLRITSDGKIGINNDTPIHAVHIKSAMASSPSYIHMQATGSNVNGGGGGISFDTSAANTNEGLYIATVAGIRNTQGNGSNDLVFSTSDQTINGAAPTEKMRITSVGDIYGPGGGRKNWFDNGSFDCTVGGRKANTSMDHGNHHAYGWVTDRFMSRNSVQWSRSTNVPTGKGFSYSTLTNGAGGQIMQAVELPDYGDMGVFTPGSYWCVSIWSTASMANSAAAFSYDLGSTKTDLTLVDNSTNNYASTGETAAGTSTGTFNRYYKVFQMPSSIISGATGIYFTWGFSAAGYATGWQLERVPTGTSKPTPYEHVHPSVTIARCRRYAYRKYNSRHVCGWKRHDSNVNWEARHPVLPTHMPSGSNQNADPYGVIMHTAGTLTNFQSVWQNPAVSALYRYGFNPADGSFILYGTSGYSGTHVVIPSYEGFEYEIQHGFF